MDLVHSDGFVIVVDGQGAVRADVLATARTHLLASGVRQADADDMLADRRGLVGRAWWAGAQIGFCGEAHPRAQPVTVVNFQGGDHG